VITPGARAMRTAELVAADFVPGQSDRAIPVDSAA